MPTSADRFPGGPILLADDAAVYLGDGSDMSAPGSLADLVDLAAGLGLGMARLHKAGRDADPHLYLTPAACDRYGLPAGPPDVRGMALAEDHPAAAALRSAGWQVKTIKTTCQVWRKDPAASVSVTLLGWVPHIDPLGLGALLAGDPSPASLARRLDVLARRTWPAAVSAGVTSERLMTAARPAERLTRDRVTGARSRVPVPGSLHRPARPSIYDAHDAHPAAQDRPAALACREESMVWTRPPAGWTEAERSAAYGVALDVNAAFLAAASSLPVGLSAPRDMTAAEVAAFNADPDAALRRRAGVYVAELPDLAGRLDARLPCPLTESGEWPAGPLPLHAPTLRYAREYGAAVVITAGAVSDECGPYLDPWQRRIVAAYLATLADAGITPDMDPAAYLAAYATLAERAPDAYAVLKAVKALVKAGIGRMRQDPGNPGVTDRATWRPDIRAEVIARTRTDLHRKMARTLALTGAAPLAVNHDAVMYASADPSPASVVPWTLDGAGVPGALRIGPRPGYVKHSHTLTMTEVLARIEAGDNPAIERHAPQRGADQ